MRLPVALSLLVAAPLAFGSPATAQQLDYNALAERFLAQYERPKASPDTLDLQELLATGFLHTPVGLFDLYFPPTANRDLEDYQRLVGAMFDAQERWIDWLEPVAADVRVVRKDLTTLSKWVVSWDLGDVASAVREGRRDMFEITGAKDKVVEAGQRFADYMTDGGPLGAPRENGFREPLVLVHDRAEFTEFLAFGGWLYPQHRRVYWQPSIVNWTNFYIDNVKVLALQYASSSNSPGNYSSGMSMDYKSSTGLEQQIVQLAANSLFANYYGERIPPSLAGALAVNLVIDLFGECNTRVDGDLRARRTSAREVFVPGGQSEGGILPPDLADSRWRTGHGSEYFADVLARAMPEKRRGKRELGAFELVDDNERNGQVIRGPFLGAAAAPSSKVPQQYFGDQLEFLRSYRSCFLHWLHEEGDGSKSERTFATLLQRLATMPDASEIEAVFTDVYGGPLSTEELGKKELEARFLTWLEKQK